MKTFKNNTIFLRYIALCLGSCLLITGALAEEKAKVIPYEFEELAVEDVSYKGTPRRVMRIRLKTEGKPTEERMIKTAKKILATQQREWKEFTVFMIYGKMKNFNFGAYGVAEFRLKGLHGFKTYESNYEIWENR